jgi:alkylated DNA repair dioxygenase AlkB
VHLEINRAAAVERLALGDGSSWVDRVDGFLAEPDAVFANVHQTTRWQQAEVLRYDAWVPEQRLSAHLSERVLPTAVRQTGLHLESRYRVKWTGVTAILYRDGHDFQGLHSDREMKWLDDTLIAILVLGQRRPFVMRQRIGPANQADRTPAGQGADDIVLLPGEGDLLVMGGRHQRDWLHGIPATDTDQPRVSLTWRWTSRRGQPDTNPGYYDGRQFSDAPRQTGTRWRPSR